MAAAETMTEFTVKTHLSLNVSDVARSTAFYEAFFGTTAHKRRTGYANFDLTEPGLKLALTENPAEAKRGGALNHLGLQVATAAQVHDTKDRLEKSGLVTFDEKDTVCCFARQDKVWVRDPDGNAWEIYVLLDDMMDSEEDDHDDHENGERICCTPAAASISFDLARVKA